MKKEKVYIVVSHKHVLKKGSKTEWDVSETVEFVDQLRNKHYTMSTAIGDYINRKMLSGSRAGMAEYSTFEEYIRKKYEKEMAELDKMYSEARSPAPVIETPAVISDEFGNVRTKTVFDKETA